MSGDIYIVTAEHNPLVVIHPDGTLEYGEGYSPDEAARAFWEAIAGYPFSRHESCTHGASWVTIREAIMEGSIPGKIATPVFCVECQRWYVEISEPKAQEN